MTPKSVEGRIGQGGGLQERLSLKLEQLGCCVRKERKALGHQPWGLVGTREELRGQSGPKLRVSREDPANEFDRLDGL